MISQDYFLLHLIINIYCINNMSYNYSIKTCCNLENQNDIYVFDIKIINFDNEIIKKNYISTDKIGDLLECKNNIKKIKICFYLLNSNSIDTMNTIILKKHFSNEINDSVILYKKNTIIYIRNIMNNNICINYQIL
jgi:hypothetical protein